MTLAPAAVDRVFQVGWAAFAQHPAEMLVWGAIVFAFQFAAAILIQVVQLVVQVAMPQVPVGVTSTVTQLLSYVISAPPLAAMAWIAILACRGQLREIGDGFAVLGRIAAVVAQGLLFVAGLALIAAVVIGPLFFMLEAGGGQVTVVLLVIAGLLYLVLLVPLTGLYYHALCHLVDGRGVMASFHFSIQMLRVNFWPTVLISILSFVLYTAGTLLCCVGLVVAVPLATSLFAALYVVGTSQPTLQIAT